MAPNPDLRTEGFSVSIFFYPSDIWVLHGQPWKVLRVVPRRAEAMRAMAKERLALAEA